MLNELLCELGRLSNKSYTMYRKHDPDTSKQAAKSVLQSLSALQSDVLAFASDCGPDGFTDDELCRAFHSTSSTYRTRRSELTRKGLIIPTDRRRKMPSGRNAVVWIHKEYAE